MSESDIDLLTVDRGLVIAPAGCGKTQLITDTLSRHTGPKPILVLTHTNAGVAALRARLDRARVMPDRYRLATLDGWALRLATMFPTRAGHSADIPARPNYPKIREAAIRLLAEGHIADILTASYARLFVDEYQDCSLRQHALVYYAAQSIPTCALGDPMQAIFGFSKDDPLAKWDDHVCGFFPCVAELERPWRWINAGSELLGMWLLEVRRKLLAGTPIDLRTAPEGVTWVQLDESSNDRAKLVAAAHWSGNDGSDRVLVIGDSRDVSSRHQLASTVPGAIVVEPVDLKSLIDFAQSLDFNAAGVLDVVLDFAENVMTGFDRPDLLRRIRSLAAGTPQQVGSHVQAALDLQRACTPQAVARLLSELSRASGVCTYRPAVLQGCIRALQLCGSTKDPTFHDAAVRVREQNRLLGRPLPKRAIGSTLLLKGLEAEAVVVLNAHRLDIRNLYVAMTRGSKTVRVCSPSHILNLKL